MEKENYCQLLGLDPLKPEGYDYAFIEKRIDDRSRKWSNESKNKQNDPGVRFSNSHLVDLVPEMKRVMSDPILKKREFDEDAKILKGMVQKLRQDCVILTDGRYVVINGVLNAYLKKLNWEGVNEKEIVKLAGVTTEPPPEVVKSSIHNAFKALRDVDSWTPIEMLNVLIQHPNLEISGNALTDGSSLAQIREAFKKCESRVTSVRPDTLPDQDSYIQTMRAVKVVLFDDKDLTKLIEYGRCNKALVPVIATLEMEYRTQLSRKYIDDLLNAKLSDDADRTMAIMILQQTCVRKKYAANFSNSDSTMTRCQFCGNMVQIDRNTSFCPHCGKSFKQICPKCGTAQQSTNAVCIKCGLNFKEDLKKADGMAMTIRMDLQRGRVEKAEKSLAALESQFPGYSSLGTLKADLSKIKEHVKASRRYLMDCFDDRRFYEAKIGIEALQEKYGGILSDDLELSARYSECVRRCNDADALYKKAQISDSKARKTAFYVAAIDQCPDHPQVKAKLREDPPEEPCNISASTDGRSISISFEPPADTANVTYSIFRSEDTLPMVTEDTKPLASIPGTSYLDKTAVPGVEYYYSVYAKRWGVLSRDAAKIGPVFMLQEVEDVNIEPITGGLRIMFTKPRGASRVRVWRSRGDNGKESALNGNDVYDDIGLEGGAEYTYLFITEYNVKGRIERTEGVRYVRSTVEFPEPVRDMAIRWNKADGTYSAKWTTVYPVTLYASKKKLNIDGRVQNMSDIESWMSRVVPIEEYSNGIKFTMEDGAIQYLYPVIQKETVGVIGDQTTVANLKPFRDVEYRICGKDCVVTMGWPPKAVGARIRIINGTEKEGDESDAETVSISAEQYRSDKQIRIPMGRYRLRTLKLYAEYMIDGVRKESRGMSVEVHSGDSSKIRYTVKKERGGVAIGIDAGSARELPPMMLVRSVEGIPLKRTDGDVVWRSNGPVGLQGGKTVVTIPDQNLKDIEHCRLFFEDDSSYYEFRFIHPLYRERSR